MKNKMLTSKNIKYGQLLDWQKEEGVVSTSVKVHFFNFNGVLIGRDYKFVPYSELRQHNDKCMWQKRYLHLKLGVLHQFIYEIKCRIITVLIRTTQHI